MCNPILGESEARDLNRRPHGREPGLGLRPSHGPVVRILNPKRASTISGTARTAFDSSKLCTTPERISFQIINAIGKSDVIVADLAGHNPNVLYELGYAHAAEKPTILLAPR